VARERASSDGVRPPYVRPAGWFGHDPPGCEGMLLAIPWAMRTEKVRAGTHAGMRQRRVTQTYWLYAFILIDLRSPPPLHAERYRERCSRAIQCKRGDGTARLYMPRIHSDLRSQGEAISQLGGLASWPPGPRTTTQQALRQAREI
jgi:hypothetical protein